MRILFLIVANLLGLCEIVAQDIVFNKTVYDLGTVSEDEDPVTATYIFTNKTKAPLAVATVRTTCGCTTANYSKAPILPGKQGSINIVYNPAGRPGVFNRSVTVFFSGKENPFVLQVKGYCKTRKAAKICGICVCIGQVAITYYFGAFSSDETGDTDAEIKCHGNQFEQSFSSGWVQNGRSGFFCCNDTSQTRSGRKGGDSHYP